METLEIFLWIVISVNFLNLIYVIVKTPFWNFDKQFLWKLWILFCFTLLIVVTIICYFRGTMEKNWTPIAVLLALCADFYSFSFVVNEFKAVMENEIHFFKVERIENGRIFGTLNISGRNEHFPAELINASRGRYKIGEKLTVKVVTCTVEEIKAEPEFN